ncbi:homing endonuclease associated repeat-containing protein [Candidatus Enterococcus moelleringii]
MFSLIQKQAVELERSLVNAKFEQAASDKHYGSWNKFLEKAGRKSR